MVKTFYEIEGNVLCIKAGFFINQNIQIHEIKSIKETNNPLSAPAMSLDRLMIKTANTSSLISPKRKGEFIAHLLKLNPAIELIYR